MKKILFIALALIVVTMATTSVAMAFLNLGFIGAIIATVVGVAVGIATGNPGAGMAIGMMVCVLVCSPGNTSNNNNNSGLPPPSVIGGGGPGNGSGGSGSGNNGGNNGWSNGGGNNAAQIRVRLEQCNATTDPSDCAQNSTGWGQGGMNIITGQLIRLRWDSTNATTCSGSLFNTNNARDNLSGVAPTSVPTMGNPRTYTISCDDSNSATNPGTDSIVTTAHDAPPTLEASLTNVKIGDTFTLSWDLEENEPTTCSFTSGVSAPTAVEVATLTEMEIEAEGTSTYRLTCGGGYDEVTVQIIPQVFES